MNYAGNFAGSSWRNWDALCVSSSVATTCNLRFTNRIILEQLVVSRVGLVSKIRNEVEGTPSGKSTEIQIVPSVVPETGL